MLKGDSRFVIAPEDNIVVVGQMARGSVLDPQMPQLISDSVAKIDGVPVREHFRL